MTENIGITTTARFHYSYEDTVEESIEAALATCGEQIEAGAKWRPNVPLLYLGAACAFFLASVADTTSWKLIGFFLVIALAALLMISSKKTRVLNVRQQIESVLRKNYDEKGCHSHDFSLDDNGLIETCPCGTSTRTWQAIKCWHETERTIVLEARNKSLYTLPKRVVPPEDLQPLRELISRHVMPFSRVTRT